MCQCQCCLDCARPPLAAAAAADLGGRARCSVMPCNYTGLYDFDVYPDLAKFGLVDYDWANAKTTWVDASPMNTDDMLVEQAARNKALNPTAKVFVYRNIVKAL
jgi:hypothetical protein